jgi:tetratricopeptide (TPR) repeat protein
MVLFGTNAHAQTITPSAGQEELNAKAFAAARANDHRLAVEFLRASLLLGEINVSHLNLGRSLSRLGRCDEARRAYQQVDASPHVMSPSRDEVLAVLSKYQAELEEQCRLTIAVDCPTEALSRVGQEEWQSCPLSARPFVAGQYLVEVRGEGVRYTELVELGSESVRVSVRSSQLEVFTTEEQVATFSHGWLVLGGGAAITLTALALEAWMLGSSITTLHEEAAAGRQARVNELREQIDFEQTLTLSLYGVGAAALLTGAVWVLIDELDSDSSLTAFPSVGSDAAAMNLRFAF